MQQLKIVLFILVLQLIQLLAEARILVFVGNLSYNSVFFIHISFISTTKNTFNSSSFI